MTVVRVQLVLECHDLLVPLVQPLCQRDHDVSLLQQELFVPVDLGLLLLDRFPLLLQLRKALFVLAPNLVPLLLQGHPKGRGIFDVFSRLQHLVLQLVNSRLQALLLLLLPHELHRALLHVRCAH